MSTPFQPLEIPPGVVAKATKKMRSSNWSEVNLVRWREGQLAPVGGQQAYGFTFASRVKRIHGWYGIDQVYRVAYLCEAHLYVSVDGAFTDISPTPALTPPGSTGAGGYGDDAYSDGSYAYGTPPPIDTIHALDKVPDAWSLDNFGAILYAMTSADGQLLKWDPAVDVVAVIQPATAGTVPKGRCFVVTNERFIMVFGATDSDPSSGPRRFAWCDQENPGAWDYASVTSQAGFLDIEPASPIITALATRSGVLFWTAKKAYQSTFLGLPYVYNYVELANNCTPWSCCSAVSTSSMAVWVSKQGAFSFDGTSILPVQCMVRPWIDDDIDDLNVREQACLVHVADFNEVWWFFPQNGQPYNTRCVIYNYKEGWWSQGQMARSAGITSSYSSHTIMANGVIAYQHEAGNYYPPDVPLPWAETFDLNLGPRLTTVKQMMPDVEGDATNLLYSLFYRNSRSLGLEEQQTAPIPVMPNGYVDFRTTGRDVRLKIELAGPAVNFVTVGAHLIDAVPRGDR